MHGSGRIIGQWSYMIITHYPLVKNQMLSWLYLYYIIKSIASVHTRIKVQLVSQWHYFNNYMNSVSMVHRSCVQIMNWTTIMWERRLGHCWVNMTLVLYNIYKVQSIRSSARVYKVYDARLIRDMNDQFARWMPALYDMVSTAIFITGNRYPNPIHVVELAHGMGSY